MIVWAVLSLLVLVPSPQASADASSVNCTFTHPRYVGSCVEQVTPEEKQTPAQACRVVLACLNDTQCVKNYCQSTTIRGGWTLVSAKASDR